MKWLLLNSFHSFYILRFSIRLIRVSKPRIETFYFLLRGYRILRNFKKLIFFKLHFLKDAIEEFFLLEGHEVAFINQRGAYKSILWPTSRKKLCDTENFFCFLRIRTPFFWKIFLRKKERFHSAGYRAQDLWIAGRIRKFWISFDAKRLKINAIYSEWIKTKLSLLFFNFF